MNEIDIKHHETVIQADELSRSVYNCSMLGRKIIAFATTRIYEKMIDHTPFWSSMSVRSYVPAAEFKISELIQALGAEKDSGRNYENIKKAVNELRHCSVEIKENDDEFRIWNWFQFIQYSKKKDRIELHFSNEIGWTLYDLKDNYTALNLRTIGEFKSFYAFRFYEIALSWIGMKGRNGNKNGTWFFQMTPEEIRHTFKISDEAYCGKYGMTNFIKKVLNAPIAELNEVNKEFKIEVSKITRGRTTIAFRFDCTELKEEKKKIVKTNSKEVRQDKRQINEEHAEIEHFKSKYPEDFVKALAEAKSQQSFPGFPRMEIIDEFEAVELMKQWGLK